VVVRASESLAKVGELSEGTRDQLWLAFRIAALEVHVVESARILICCVDAAAYFFLSFVGMAYGIVVAVWGALKLAEDLDFSLGLVIAGVVATIAILGLRHIDEPCRITARTRRAKPPRGACRSFLGLRPGLLGAKGRIGSAKSVRFLKP